MRGKRVEIIGHGWFRKLNYVFKIESQIDMFWHKASEPEYSPILMYLVTFTCIHLAILTPILYT